MGQMPMQPQPQKAPSQGASWCIPDFQAYTGSGTIAWSVTFIATFLAPADRFDGELEKSFLPFVSSLEVLPPGPPPEEELTSTYFSSPPVTICASWLTVGAGSEPPKPPNVAS